MNSSRQGLALNDTSKTARQVHDDVEHTLGSRTSSADDLGGRLEDVAKRGGARVWCAMKRHPFLAASTLAVGGVALAMTVGAAELTLGTAFAFAVYKVLREGEPPIEAVEDIERRFG